MWLYDIYAVLQIFAIFIKELTELVIDLCLRSFSIVYPLPFTIYPFFAPAQLIFKHTGLPVLVHDRAT